MTTPDLADIVGYPDAVEALTVAAAGGHHIFLIGPPSAPRVELGAGLASILPDLTMEQAIEVAGIRALAGLAPVSEYLRPPLEQPHHTASAAALIGGGSSLLRPGAAVRAHRGVLLLEDAPDFSPTVLDALRQPLESQRVTLARASGTVTWPAHFQLVLTSQPCPCGNAGTIIECLCTPFAQRRYLGRLSGPLLDRVDIRIRLEGGPLSLLPSRTVVKTEDARERVTQARQYARVRLQGTPWTTNAEVPGMWLRSPQGLPESGETAVLDRSLERGGITMRGYDRVLRMAWTLADLDGATRPTAEHIDRAMQLRQAAT